MQNCNLRTQEYPSQKTFGFPVQETFYISGYENWSFQAFSTKFFELKIPELFFLGPSTTPTFPFNSPHSLLGRSWRANYCRTIRTSICGADSWRTPRYSIRPVENYGKKGEKRKENHENSLWNAISKKTWVHYETGRIFFVKLSESPQQQPMLEEPVGPREIVGKSILLRCPFTKFGCSSILVLLLLRWTELNLTLVFRNSLDSLLVLSQSFMNNQVGKTLREAYALEQRFSITSTENFG